MTAKEQNFFDEMYRNHYDSLYQFIQRLIRDADSAYDLTQETFTLAYLQIEKLLVHSNPAGWIYKTARNLSMNYLRLRYHKNLSDDALLMVSDGKSLEESVLQHFFPNASLRKWLSEQDIAILLDRFEYGYSLEETAERQGITYSACKMRISRIYQKIRNHPEILLLLVIAVEVL